MRLIQTPWTDPALRKVLEKGEGKIDEPEVVTLYRLQALEKSKRIHEMLNLARMAGKKIYELRAFVYLGKNEILLNQIFHSETSSEVLFSFLILKL